MAFDLNNIDWRGRRLWQGVGYFASAAWMVYVLAVSGGDVEHKLFDYIFIVPIGMWAVGLAVAWAIRKRAGPRL
jgi:hypothetical protein